MYDDRVELTLQLARDAHSRIADSINRTPVFTSETIDKLAGVRVYFKCENFQKSGAFKARGATNAVLQLSADQAASGVVTHSSGNHAAALSRAAKLRGIPAHIVMPENSSKAKIASVRRYGGVITFCEPTLEARESVARSVMEETGATFIHPYDDLRVMAGQGTAALELIEQISQLDTLICPVGGGGLLSGCALVAKSLLPDIKVVAAEPALADDAHRSFEAGHIIPSLSPTTIADGLLTSLGDKTFPIIQRCVDDVMTVSDEAIRSSMRLIWEVLKIIVEPSAAVGLATILENGTNGLRRNVAIILTGGNVDLDNLPW